MTRMIFALLLVGGLAVAGMNEQETKKGGGSMTQKKTVSEVLQQQTGKLMGIPGVVGTGEGVHEGKPCILVFVEKRSPALTKKIPRTLGGYTVVVRAVGKVKPLK